MSIWAPRDVQLSTKTININQEIMGQVRGKKQWTRNDSDIETGGLLMVNNNGASISET